MGNLKKTTANLLISLSSLGTILLYSPSLLAVNDDSKLSLISEKEWQEDEKFIIDLVKDTVITLSREEQKVFNYSKNLKDYKQRIKRGDFSAMYYLAYCYEYGVAIEKNEDKSIELYTQLQRKANDKIKAMALLQLAIIYTQRGGQKNYVQAIYDIGAAITFDYADAYSLFADAAFYGRGLDQSIPMGVKYLKLGAKNKSGACLYKLGDIAGKGLYGQHKDPTKELDCYKKSAALNNADGLVALAKYYYGRKSLVLNEKLVIEPDLEKASELLQKAVRYDVTKYPELIKIYKSVTDAESRRIISIFYFLQQLVKIDPYNNFALLELGKCYIMGYGVKMNVKTGERILETLVARKDNNAEMSLAILYGRGINYKYGNIKYSNGLEYEKYTNPKRAFDIYHHLADVHNMCNLEVARFYFSGAGGNEVNEKEALKYITKAFDNNENIQHIFKLLTSYYGLPNYYATDERSIASSPAGTMALKTLAIVEKYLKKHNADKDALMYLANLYYYGVGVKKNKQKFVSLVKIAFERGIQDAGVALVTIYLKGVGDKIGARVDAKMALVKAIEYLNRPMHSSNEIIIIIDKFAKYEPKILPELVSIIKTKAAKKQKFFNEALAYCSQKGYAIKNERLEK